MDTNSIPLITTALVAVSAFLAAGSVPSVWDMVTKKYVADLAPTISALGIDETRIPIFLRWWGMALIATFIILGVWLRMVPVALPAMFLVFIAPRIWIKWQIERRRILLRDQLVGATVALANTARAGMSLAQGLELIYRESPQPLAQELGRIVADFKRGLSLARAISSVKNRLQVDSFTLFSAAILTSLERGGRITDTLERISHSLQENQRIERKVESETASGRKVVRMLAVFPLFFLVLFMAIFPQGTIELFQSSTGQMVLAFVILLVYLSVRWSNRILAINV